MSRLNCWEVKHCGRNPGGANAAELGVCPAAVAERTGVNHGANGGRICWAVAGTLCRGKVQGTYAQKLGNCFDCAFHHTVKREEGVDFKLFPVS